MTSPLENENAMAFFSQNVDSWGAAEWFDRMANAVRSQDRCVVRAHNAAPDDKASHELMAETFRLIASASAFTLVHDHEEEVRKALSTLSQKGDEDRVLTDALIEAPDPKIGEEVLLRAIITEAPGEEGFLQVAVRQSNSTNRERLTRFETHLSQIVDREGSQ